MSLRGFIGMNSTMSCASHGSLTSTLDPPVLEGTCHHPVQRQNRIFDKLTFYGLPTASQKNWTGDAPLYRAFSRRQSFETHTNWFALIPQVHGAQPVDHRCEQALISSGS